MILATNEKRPEMPDSSDEYITVRKQLLADFAQSVNDLFGREGDTVFFLIGEKAGRRSAGRRLKESLGEKDMAIRRLGELKREQNWGDIEFSGLDLDGKTGKINLKNCFDVAFKSNVGECYFMRGFLTGFLSEVFQEEITVSNSYDKPCGGACTQMFWASGSDIKKVEDSGTG